MLKLKGRPASFGLVLVIAAILGWRSREVLLHPTLRVEDGYSIFSFFYAHRALGNVLRFKSGYLPLVPNLIGWLGVRLPLVTVPYYFAVVPTLLAIGACASILAPAFRPLIPSERVRRAVALGLAVLPIGQYMLVSHTDYSIWTLLFLAILWSFPRLPERWLGAVPAVFAQQLAVWSHPVACVAAPINAFHLARGPGWRQRLLQAAMLLGHAVHLVVGTEHGKIRAAALSASVGTLFMRGLRLSLYALVRVAYGPDLGLFLTNHVPGNRFTLGLPIVALAVGCAALRGSRHRAILAALGYGLFAVSFAISASKGLSFVLKNARYTHVEFLLAALLVCVVAASCLAFVLARVKLGALARERIAWVAALALPAWFALGNTSSSVNYLELASPHNAPVVAQCMRDLAALEREHHGPCGFELTCHKRDDWPIVIRTRACDDAPREPAREPRRRKRRRER